MDAVSLLLLVFLLVVTIFPLWDRRRKLNAIARAINCLGGDKSYPIVGTDGPLLKAGRKNFWKEYQERTTRNGSVFRSWSGSNPVIHLCKPEHMEIVLNSSTHNIDKGFSYKLLKAWFGDGLLTTTRNKWIVHRKLLTPTFHFSILENFSEIFSAKSQKVADQIQPLANGKYFDVYPYITHYALDVICETSMGVKIDSMNKSDSGYVAAVSGMLAMVTERMFNPLHHIDFIYGLTEKGKIHNKHLQVLNDFTEKVIKERQAQLEQLKPEDRLNENTLGIKKKQNFLDLLLRINETNKDIHLTLKDIKDEVSTFVFGGHDTSTVSSCWTLFLLGNNPDIQEKVHQELDGIFRGEENPVTSHDLIEMKYLECVIKESMRIFPVVPSVTRLLSTEIDIDGHKIPAGVTAVLHIHQLHKDPEIYPEPNRFNPDRFLPENVRNKHPYSYIPFSAGPRNCIGQKFAMRNIKTLLATLLRRYNVRSMKKPHEMECYYDLFLKPQDGIYLSFEVRNPKEINDHVQGG